MSTNAEAAVAYFRSVGASQYPAFPGETHTQQPQQEEEENEHKAQIQQDHHEQQHPQHQNPHDHQTHQPLHPALHRPYNNTGESGLNQHVGQHHGHHDGHHDTYHNETDAHMGYVYPDPTTVDGSLNTMNNMNNIHTTSSPGNSHGTPIVAATTDSMSPAADPSFDDTQDPDLDGDEDENDVTGMSTLSNKGRVNSVYFHDAEGVKRKARADQFRSEVEERTRDGESCAQIAQALVAKGVQVTDKSIGRWRLQWGFRKRAQRKITPKPFNPNATRKGVKPAAQNLRKEEISRMTQQGLTVEEISQIMSSRGMVLKKGTSTILRLQTRWGLLQRGDRQSRKNKRHLASKKARAGQRNEFIKYAHELGVQDMEAWADAKMQEPAAVEMRRASVRKVVDDAIPAPAKLAREKGVSGSRKTRSAKGKENADDTSIQGQDDRSDGGINLSTEAAAVLALTSVALQGPQAANHSMDIDMDVDGDLEADASDESYDDSDDEIMDDDLDESMMDDMNDDSRLAPALRQLDQDRANQSRDENVQSGYNSTIPMESTEYYTDVSHGPERQAEKTGPASMPDMGGAAPQPSIPAPKGESASTPTLPPAQAATPIISTSGPAPAPVEPTTHVDTTVDVLVPPNEVAITRTMMRMADACVAAGQHVKTLMQARLDGKPVSTSLTGLPPTKAEIGIAVLRMKDAARVIMDTY